MTLDTFVLGCLGYCSDSSMSPNCAEFVVEIILGENEISLTFTTNLDYTQVMWYLGDMLVSSDTEYTPLGDGPFTVVVSNSSCAITSLPFEYFIDDP